MRKLLCLQGLPGSGKTTLALKMGAEGDGKVARVNKDDIRAQLVRDEGWVWSPSNEKRVEEIRDTLIHKAFAAGMDVVISDDTNLARKHRVRLEEIARTLGVGFEVMKLDTTIEECIRRDALRVEGQVGESVIKRMAEQYNLAKPQEMTFKRVEPSPLTLMPAIICDLDGTLSLFKEKGHRGPYDATKCAEDECNPVVRKIIEVFSRMMGYQIIYVSGREECFREQTMEFFRRHTIPSGPLHMRQTGDRRKDWIVKGELFDAHIRDKYNVVMVLDDRDQVVEFWRGIGLTCLQVAKGDF